MEKKVQSYNFRRPDRISTNQIRSLHFVHDRFTRNASSSLSAYLRTIVEISLESIEQVTVTEFFSHAARLELPSIIGQSGEFRTLDCLK
jgi:flagellar motor switch protein FliM